MTLPQFGGKGLTKGLLMASESQDTIAIPGSLGNTINTYSVTFMYRMNIPGLSISKGHKEGCSSLQCSPSSSHNQWERLQSGKTGFACRKSHPTLYPLLQLQTPIFWRCPKLIHWKNKDVQEGLYSAHLDKPPCPHKP